MWIEGVELEDEARAQLMRAASMPFIHHHIAVMPDAHGGVGCTIGSVIPMLGAVVPAFPGVDLGCGILCLYTGLRASDLPESLALLRSDLEAAIPHGRTNNGQAGDRGAWAKPPETAISAWTGLSESYLTVDEKVRHKGALNQLGTLGSGNHFVELCLDEGQGVWLMIHSGSRGAGNKIGQSYIEKAKEDMRRYFINLPDQNLAYLVEGSEHYDKYVAAVDWAQQYALVNREVMAINAMNVLARHFPDKVTPTIHRGLGVHGIVSCHHNYLQKEYHYGKSVIVSRKGAVEAKLGQLAVIPGSMGAKSFIVRGKGNPESFNSCSHGAGRKMSRQKAKQVFSLEDHAKATAGIECRKDIDVLDETPGAYKDIDAVMAAQDDLVEIVHTLKQVLCIKG